MTEKEILDANILIADFMQWQSYWLHGGKKGNTVCPSMDRLYGYILPVGLTQKTMNKEPFENVEYLKFHISWDWLMPVVEKIEKDNDYIFEISKDYISVFRFSDRSGLALKENTFTHGMGKIHAIYLAVIKLINIHNENKKS